MSRLETPTLEGRRIRLEPLSLDRHWEGLLGIGTDPDLWVWAPRSMETAEDLRAYLEEALRERDAGRALPFATVDSGTGRPVGCTRFGNLDLANRRVEIGWTWIGRPFQRTHVNTEAKYLMLRHAFEVLGCVRVELKTHARNSRSRAAILRLGAREEGTLRKHLVNSRGEWRDTVYFSVLDHEWPEVKAGLERKLEGGPA